ncbi:hypothetical protein MVES1_003233 [Malassezia vespertilionis]|uniref:uncharacterized protein n=1 Tax=Malassezia vespertilionis TaxID=2020962 RepID=UPI0024B15DB9|nr:uncharacterized protein MVES1_003233 [Malassezia vespertilionis]WFD07865.1 hypothetical protein MVES1_003233 [Malassezia vespertilionis]
MQSSIARCLRIEPLPKGMRANAVVQRQAKQHAERAAPKPRAPSVLERLASGPAPLPTNLRLVPFVPRKERYWKVHKDQRDILMKELKET